MSFGKLFTFVFGIIFIILLYVIIYYALKIMYKDVKTGGKAKNNNSGIRYGIEVIQTGVNSTLEQGAVVPIRNYYIRKKSRKYNSINRAFCIR